PGLPEISTSGRMGVMEARETTKPHPSDLREQAIRLVREVEAGHASQWAAIRLVAAKMGCNPETLRIWVRRDERDRGARPGLTVDDALRDHIRRGGELPGLRGSQGLAAAHP